MLTWKRSRSSSNNSKHLKFYGRKVESTRNSNFGDYQEKNRLYSNLETGRYGPKSGDSRIIRESDSTAPFANNKEMRNRQLKTGNKIG